MLAESKSKITQRFLQANCRFGQEAIDIWHRECRLRCRKKEKSKAYFTYLNWKESKYEIALFTLYAYADLEMPKGFSCIFDFRNPERYSETKMKLTQSIWEAWFPINSISHGHKHLAIFSFEEEIPELIFELHQEKEKFSSVPKDSLILGICQIEDYNKIKEYLIMHSIKKKAKA